MKILPLFIILQCIVFAYCQLPEIVGGSESLTVLEGNHANLRCQVRNLGDYRVSWIRQPSSILTLGRHPYSPQDQRFSVTVTPHGDWILNIANVTAEDTNTYVCDVNTSPSIKHPVTLTVAVPAKIDYIEPLEVAHLDNEDARKRIFNASASAVFFCVTSGIPKPRVSWTRHNGEFPEGGTSKDTDTLVFDSLDRTHAGVYECTANNGYGGFAAEYIDLVIQYKPVLRVLGDNDLRLGPGSRVQIRTATYANPPPIFTWYKGNVTLNNIISGQQRNGEYSSEYIIERLDIRTDFGSYRVEATNMLGTDVVTFSISGQPKSPIINSRREGLKRTEYTLTWLAPHYGGSPISEYRILYRKKLQSVSNDTSLQYEDWEQDTYIPSYHTTNLQRTLYNLSSSSEYDLRLWGINDYGEGDKATFGFLTNSVDVQTTLEPTAVTTKARPIKTTGKSASTKSTQDNEKETGPVVKDVASKSSISFCVLATSVILYFIL